MVIVLQALVHLMGFSSSPAIANWVPQHHGTMVKEQFSMAVYLAIMLCFYVDDYLDSFRTIKEAREMKKDLTEALALGGFELVKWKSNFPDLNDVIVCPPQVPDLINPDLANFDHQHQESDSGRIADVRDGEEVDDDDENANGNSDIDPTHLNEQIKNMFEDNQVGDLSDMLSDQTNEKVLGVGFLFEQDVLYNGIGKKLDREVRTKKELL